MTITATESSGFLPPVPGSGSAAGSNLDKDTFLQLLVAQLRYQDPLNPTDQTQFLAQTAQFTSLEKMEVVAEQTAQAFAAQMAFGASSLVGQSVTYRDGGGAEVTGAVESVRFGTSGPMLCVGGVEVDLTSVVRVGQTAGTDVAPTSAAPDPAA
jgi:flagellar basal-body rod modification protein FlgD